MAVVTVTTRNGSGVATRIEKTTYDYDDSGFRISAQAHLQPIYAALGFVRVGDDYVEDDIPHVEMLRSPP